MNISKTTTTTRGVSEAMVERFKAAFAEHSTISPAYDGCIRAGIEAALSAPEPAAHGKAVAIVRHFDYRGIARNGFSQEAQMLDGAPALPDGTKLYTARPPAQPAERVPEGLKLAIAHIQQKADAYVEENCGVEWDTGATTYHHGQAGEDYHHGLLELVDELTQLASPAPSEGGKGADRD